MKRSLQIPPDHLHLITTGHLMAREREALGFLPQMMCGRCEERPVDLIWRHRPLGKNYFKPANVRRRKGRKRIDIPGAVWGTDVTVICPCCSFPKCPHKGNVTP